MTSFGFSWLALLYLTLLLLAVTQPKSWLGASLRFPPLRWLGRVAYGVYLLHATIFLGLLVSLPRLSLSMAVFVASMTTLVVASISWLVFEKPLIDLGHRLSSLHMPET